MSKNKYSSWLCNNYFNLIEASDCGNQKRCIINKSDNPFEKQTSLIVFGTSVLSYSKKIMTDVMKYVDKDSFYTDTDSIHLLNSAIKTIESKYNNKTRKLIGEEMGQFHSDFEYKDPKTEKSYSKLNGGPIVAIKSIFNAKKFYIDYLLYTDDEGILQLGTHMRAKGINQKALTPEIYQQIYDGDSKVIDSVMEGSPKFKINQSIGTIESLSKFERTISKDKNRSNDTYP